MKRIYRLTVVLFFIMACESEKKQFTKLSHKDTGIDFVNKLYETNTRNYFTYPYMYLGGGVATGDFNNDGLEDLVLGNLGRNYKYQASKEEPFEVFYDDFDDNGSKDIVLAYYNYGIQFPLRGFSCSSQQVPELKNKFQKYDLFASLDVKDVYGEVNLDNALRLHANTFKSVVLINDNSSFESIDLPYQAQFSSINDFLIDDYNNDGNKDILMAGNLFTSEVETTRNDASYGLVLTGNGDGTFKAMSRKETGFYAPSDAKKLHLIKLKDEQGIIVGNNNDLIQYFKRIE